MGKKILFTEKERNRFDKRLGRGFKKMGEVGLSYAKKEIGKQRKIAQTERNIYNKAFKKAQIREIQKKARQDVRDKYKKKKDVLGLRF